MNLNVFNWIMGGTCHPVLFINSYKNLIKIPTESFKKSITMSNVSRVNSGSRQSYFYTAEVNLKIDRWSLCIHHLVRIYSWKGRVLIVIIIVVKLYWLGKLVFGKISYIYGNSYFNWTNGATTHLPYYYNTPRSPK